MLLLQDLDKEMCRHPLLTLCLGESLQMLQWKRNSNSCEKRGQPSCEGSRSWRQCSGATFPVHMWPGSALRRDFWVHTTALGQCKHKINGAITIHSSQSPSSHLKEQQWVLMQLPDAVLSLCQYPKSLIYTDLAQFGPLPMKDPMLSGISLNISRYSYET